MDAGDDSHVRHNDWSAVAIFLGRPLNLWTGLIAAAVSTSITIIGATQPAATAQQWAIILGAIGGFLGFVVAFLAGQPPTLSIGDSYSIATPKGSPNYTATVATPPAPTQPVPDGGQP